MNNKCGFIIIKNKLHILKVKKIGRKYLLIFDCYSRMFKHKNNLLYECTKLLLVLGLSQRFYVEMFLPKMLI